ncbi:ATP-dependent RecD-like DNA helicase [Fimbriiglobus ruber]|uniref:RecD-like DNA helicase YrrC n=1 Tax=Fimbriiglobus ruber TaxID=1908690 RepID=A0A225DQZ8_9BACT|nr:ATP-dependent RecD-like DNA helicase [Fimbriiglobus ruber]OWK43721.1 RecD-like DNA helicase YrrC [Fimbriiglobus ruber]
MPDKLTGAIERITFHNLDNGYCVLRVLARGHRDLVTVVGHLSQVIAGEFIEAVGEWTTDRNFGQQFKADELRTTPPHSAAGIAKYLGSGLVKGIGPKYAQKIVDAFGEKTLDVIDQSPTFLSQVKGIGPKRIERIRQGWQEQRAVRSIMVFLHTCGVGTARAVRIYKTYGENAIELVRSNPYRLSEDIWGVGFRTADDIARQLGIPPDSPLRARAAVRHILKEASSNGHVGLPEPLVLNQTCQLTHIDPKGVQDAIEQLRIEDEIVRDTPFQAAGVHKRPELTGDPVFDEFESLLYLKSLFMAELGVARMVKALQQGDHPLPALDVDAALAWIERKMGISFADAQREAVRAAVTRKMLVLTGGPGTGKTTIVRAILEIFLAKHQRVALCAPTGRAAKRLTESTGREAKTIHRLLEFDVGIGGFRRNKENPLDLDLLVVDETSMADVVLMNQLLRAIPPWACVVLVGDIDQLPSVGPGSVLADLIGSGTVAVVRLSQVHRQANASWIVRAAHAINHGEEPESAPPGGEGDFYFIEANDENVVVEKIITMVKDRIPARFGFDSFKDIQVLAPMNKAVVGVQNLNKQLQDALNPGGAGAKEVQRFGTTFRVGDKVIQTQNNYTREVFNGDIGRITRIETVDQIVEVTFDGREVEYEFGDLDELQLAYACSIHKSQGSEYPAVVIPIHTQHFIMLQRNLIYTGITRGKKLVALVGSRKALGIAVRKADTARRFSLLKWRLQASEES